MEKIKIITDSASDLPKSVIEKYDIEVIPLLVNIKGKTYRDGEDLDFNNLVKKMEESGEFPVTTQINPQRFSDCYKKYIEQGYKIISIHLSSKMSGTYQSACIAKEMLETENITIIDGLNVTAGLGILVIKACQLKNKGLTVEEIKEEIIKTIPHVKSALIFNSLDNLVKGGRLSKTAGAIGNILGIKLVLEVKDGEMSVMGKVRGTKKGVRTILNYLKEKGMKDNESILFLNAKNEEVHTILKKHLDENNNEYIETTVGCVVGTHSGVGACGVFFIEDY